MWLLLFSLLCSPAKADSASDAIGKAQEAAYIQSGAKQIVDKAQRHFEQQTLEIIKDVGLEKELASTLVLYRIYRTKELTFQVKNYRININTDRISVSWKF